MLSKEIEERRAAYAELRKDLDTEALARDEALAAERRCREVGDLQVVESWKAAVREEREAREGDVALAARELLGIQTQLAEGNAKREDERSQQHLALHKVRADSTELKGERRVDVVAMREAMGQVTEELKAAQPARK